MAASRPDAWIWIVRWEEFQHYTPSRDRGPAWIKAYAAQLDDERYLRLTDRQRALLWDIRLMFSASRGRISYGSPTTLRHTSDDAPTSLRRRSDDAALISRRRNSQTRNADIEALNHAGFIEIVSREGLEQRLEKLYASRAPARSREPEPEPDTEKEKNQNQGGTPDQDYPDEPDTGPDPSSAGLADLTIEPPAAGLNGYHLDPHAELQLTQVITWIGTDADERTPAVVRHNWTTAPEAARVELLETIRTAKPRHRGRYVVATLKTASRRARGEAA